MGFPKFNNIFKKQPKVKNVLVAVCVHRGMDAFTFNSLKKLEFCSDPKITVYPVFGEALLSKSRSRVATDFFRKKEFDVLFFIDDDIVFEPIDVAKISYLVRSGFDIVGGAYPMKNYVQPYLAVKPFKDKSIKFGPDGGLQEVRMLATGFMAIGRHVFEKMVESETVPLCDKSTLNYYPFFNPFYCEIEGEIRNLSEDYSFCKRATDLGFKVWVDGTTKLGHAGRYVYTQDEIFRTEKKVIENFEYFDNEVSVSAVEIKKDS